MFSSFNLNYSAIYVMVRTIKRNGLILLMNDGPKRSIFSFQFSQMRYFPKGN